MQDVRNLVEVITYSFGSVMPKLESYPDKYTVLEDESVKLKVDKIQTEREDEHRVSLVCCLESDLEWLAEVFDLCSGIAYVNQGQSVWDMVTDEEKISLGYNRVYLDENNEQQLKPEKFGQFMR